MVASTKDKMIAGAADLLARRGVHGTSLRDVVQHTGTPRGSLAHHFPGGKPQMLEEAVRYAGERVASPLKELVTREGPAEGVRQFIAWWGGILRRSDFQAGCPVLTVAVDPLAEDLPDGDGEVHASRVGAAVREAFSQWQLILADALEQAGLARERSLGIAAMCVAATEGAVAISRVERSLEPLERVSHELERLIKTALADSVLIR